MNLDLNRITEKLQQNDFIKNFIEELSGALENFSHQNQVKSEKMEEESDLQLGFVYFSAADIDLLCDFSLCADVWAADRV